MKVAVTLLILGQFLITNVHSTRVSNVILPFTTDGCSVVPDMDFTDCCIVHDYAYWKGGSKEERDKSDLELSQCIETKSNKTIASIFYNGVRVGGSPLWRTSFRWGYGWQYYRGYLPLSKDEEGLIEDLNFSLQDALNTPLSDPQNFLKETPSRNNDYCLDEIEHYLSLQYTKKNLELFDGDLEYKLLSTDSQRLSRKSKRRRVYQVKSKYCHAPIYFDLGNTTTVACTKMRTLDPEHKFIVSVDIPSECL